MSDEEEKYYTKYIAENQQSVCVTFMTEQIFDYGRYREVVSPTFIRWDVKIHVVKPTDEMAEEQRTETNRMVCDIMGLVYGNEDDVSDIVNYLRGKGFKEMVTESVVAYV